MSIEHKYPRKVKKRWYLFFFPINFKINLGDKSYLHAPKELCKAT